MAYSVDWIAKVISVPTADLTLVSGTRYSLDMADFLTEVRRLEWEFTEGLWAPAVVKHTDTRYDFAGVNYAPFDDMLNDYTVQITGVATRVDLLGSNNDIIDVLIPTGVSVVPSNSAGLQIVTSGSGVTQQDKDDITQGVWTEPEAVIVKKMVYNKTVFNDVSKILTIYEDNGVDVWKQFDLTDKGRVEV